MTDRSGPVSRNRTRQSSDRHPPGAADEAMREAIARALGGQPASGSLGPDALLRADPLNRQARLLALQRTIGNRAVSGLIQGRSGPASPIRRDADDEEALQTSEESAPAAVDVAPEEPAAPVEEAPAEPVSEATDDGAGGESTDGGGSAEPAEDGDGEAPSDDGSADGGLASADDSNADDSGAATGLIVEDGEDTSLGQMTKGDFLGAVRTGVDATVSTALGDESANAQPEVDRRFAQYAGLPAPALEASIHQQIPGSSAVPAAQLYVPMIVAAVAAGLRADDDTAPTPNAAPDQTGDGFNHLGRVLTMARPGREGTAHAEFASPRLGQSQPLPADQRDRMESAFGAQFGDVRIHTDADAARSADRLGARAFTIGRDVAFGPNEYQPGTLMGDALLAHELAHVIQQRSSATDGPPASLGEVTDASLEDDADTAATGVLASLWGRGKRGLGDLVHQAMPRLRSGIAIQSCKGKAKTDCLHPINPQLAGRLPNLQNFGMIVIHTWQAPAGHTPLELKGCIIRESLQFSDIPNPPFIARGGGKDPRSGTKKVLGQKKAEDGRTSDNHTHPRDMVADPPTPSSYSVDQIYEYQCPDCGDDWVRFDHNVITYTITREDGGPTTFTTAKTPDNGSPQGVEESF